MKPRPKLRTFCRWMLTILTVMLVVVWIGSGWCVFYSLPMSSIYGTRGALHYIFDRGTFYGDIELRSLSRADFNTPDWWFVKKDPVGIDLWRWDAFADRTRILAEFPLWIPSLLLAIPTAALWRKEIIARRLRRLRECSKCGYDITGLMGKDACPECGTRFEIAKSQTSAS